MLAILEEGRILSSPMPRLTNHAYLSTRSFLAALWEDGSRGVFVVLPGYAQRDLYDFFAFTVFMDDDEALEHRARMTAAFPSLPQAAGRALEALRAHLEGRPNRMLDRHETATTRMVRGAGSGRTVHVEALTRPQPDIDALRAALDQLEAGRESVEL